VEVEATSWQPDPFGVHEFRFFAADGKPTLLVMDRGETSYDPPPVQRPSPAPEPAGSAEHESRPVLERPAPSAEATARPALGPTLTLASQDAPDDAPREVAEPPRREGAISDDQAEARGVTRLAVPVAGNSFGVHSAPAVEQSEPEALSRPRKVAYVVVFAALVLSALGLAYVHLRPSETGPSTPAAGATTTTASRTGPSTSSTTTVALPTALSSSADAAATALVSSWSAGNKATALTVATPTAVATLFAAPYKSGLAIARGCSTDFSPIVCTFGPPGGASPSDAIYQVLASQTAGGWYVTSVRIQG
jgi:hypothetical protein